MMTMHQSNVEEIFKFTDALVFAKMGKHLSDVQRLLIQTAWFKPGQRYDEIARETGYSATYLKQDAGPKLWRLLSDILGEKVKKNNFRAAMERRTSVLPELFSPAATTLQESSLPTPSNPWAALQKDDEGEIVHQSQIEAIHRYQDWGEAPDVSIFYDRSDETAILEHWIVTNCCRLVGLFGMGGTRYRKTVSTFQYTICRFEMLQPSPRTSFFVQIAVLCNGNL